MGKQKPSTATTKRPAGRAGEPAAKARGVSADAAGPKMSRKSNRSVAQSLGKGSGQKLAQKIAKKPVARPSKPAAKTVTKTFGKGSNPTTGKPKKDLPGQLTIAPNALPKPDKNRHVVAAVKRPRRAVSGQDQTTRGGTTVTSNEKPRAAKDNTSAGSKAKLAAIVLPADYAPSEAEPFMNGLQRLYFRQKLINWKEDIIRQTRETLLGLHEESTQHADLADRATSETDRALELRARDRQRKLVAKIDAALARIEDGSYGFCEETGEPIGLKRLDARPIATLSLEAQERHERRERVYREE